MHRCLFVLSLAALLLGLGCPPPDHPNEHYDGSSPFTGGDLFGDDDDWGDDDDAVGDDDDYHDVNMDACEDFEDYLAGLECEGTEYLKVKCEKWAAAPCDLTDMFDCLHEALVCDEETGMLDFSSYKDCMNEIPADCM